MKLQNCSIYWRNLTFLHFVAFSLVHNLYDSCRKLFKYGGKTELQSKVETVKQRKKKKADHRDEKKDIHELSVKMGMDSKTVREESSLKRTVGLKRVTKNITYQGSMLIV